MIIPNHFDLLFGVISILFFNFFGSNDELKQADESLYESTVVADNQLTLYRANLSDIEVMFARCLHFWCEPMGKSDYYIQELSYLCFEHSMAIRESILPQKSLAQYYHRLGKLNDLSYEFKDLERSNAYHKKALAFIEALPEASLEDLFIFTNSLGCSFRELNDTHNAGLYLRKAWEILQKTQRPAIKDKISILNNLGAIESDLWLEQEHREEHLLKALEYFKIAEELSVTLPQDDIVLLYNNMARMYGRLKRIDDVLAVCQKALPYIESRNIPETSIDRLYQDLLWVYNYKQDFNAKLKYLNELIDLVAKRPSPSLNDYLADLHGSLGSNYEEHFKDYERAIRHYSIAFDIYQQRFNKIHVELLKEECSKKMNYYKSRIEECDKKITCS